MKRLALGVLFLSISALAITYAAALIRGSAPLWGAWVFAIATSSAMTATMVLGAAREGKPRGGLGPLMLPFGLIFTLLVGGFALALTLPAAGEPIILGLPRRAAVILYGIGLLPVVILPIAYALAFDDTTLNAADIERIREAAAEREQSERAGDIVP